MMIVQEGVVLCVFGGVGERRIEGNGYACDGAAALFGPRDVAQLHCCSDRCGNMGCGSAVCLRKEYGGPRGVKCCLLHAEHKQTAGCVLGMDARLGAAAAMHGARPAIMQAQVTHYVRARGSKLARRSARQAPRQQLESSMNECTGSQARQGRA